VPLGHAGISAAKHLTITPSGNPKPANDDASVLICTRDRRPFIPTPSPPVPRSASATVPCGRQRRRSPCLTTGGDDNVLGRSCVVLQEEARLDDFEVAFPPLYQRAYGVAFVILGDRTEAEDVAAEATARALARWSKVCIYATPWTIRVAGNLSIDRIRSQRRVPPLGGHDPSTPTGVERVDLQRALLRLPKRQREVLVLRFIADLPEAAVAESLGCSTGTVKSHASRGLAALRLSLNES